MNLLLDTNILSELIRKRPDPDVITQLRRRSPAELFTTVFTVMELRYGAARRPDREAFWSRIKAELLSRVQVVGYDARAARAAGDLRATLEGQGLTTGLIDTQIAAIALSRGWPVVTRNHKDFTRFPRLEVISWHASPPPPAPADRR
jgi:predicted nucleic acid-binding protein